MSITIISALNTAWVTRDVINVPATHRLHLPFYFKRSCNTGTFPKFSGIFSQEFIPFQVYYEGILDIASQVCDDNGLQVMDDTALQVMDDTALQVIDDTALQVVDDNGLLVMDDTALHVMDDTALHVMDLSPSGEFPIRRKRGRPKKVVD